MGVKVKVSFLDSFCSPTIPRARLIKNNLVLFSLDMGNVSSPGILAAYLGFHVQLLLQTSNASD